LYDISMKTNTENNIIKLFKQWAKWYRAEFEEFAAIAPEQVQEQIDFIENYLNAMLMEQPENEKRKWAEQFFEVQKACLDEDTFQLQFMGGLSYGTLYVRDISEPDLSTVYDLTEFETITIDRGDGKDWTKQDIKAILRDIRDDLEFDFNKVSLKHSLECNALNINCRIRE